MRKIVKVYIASPYTIGNQEKNVGNQMKASSKLIDLGFAPFAPLYSHYIHILDPKNYDIWIMLDLEWLKVCDCVLRLPGESKGAALEVEEARRLGKPIFKSIDDLSVIYKGIYLND